MRGYIGFGKESGLEEYFEPKEGYSYGYNWLKNNENNENIDSIDSIDSNSQSTPIFTNSLQGYNIWPVINKKPYFCNISSISLFNSEHF